jgi:outer membrane receptor for ferrienterochelin and colicins
MPRQSVRAVPVRAPYAGTSRSGPEPRGPCGRHAVKTKWIAGFGRLLVAVTIGITLLPGSIAIAQAGRIVGTVRDARGNPLADAQVLVVGTRLGAITSQDGTFTISSVPAGLHQLRLVRIGFRAPDAPIVAVRQSGASEIEIHATDAPVVLSNVVVSPSRRAELWTDALATVTRVHADAIDNSVGNSYSGVLKDVKGLDYIQTGLTRVTINARGFNSTYNNRMLMLEDDRVAATIAIGLPLGQFTAIPKVDLAGVEVLVGPGAALYGADASNGVLTLQTKDPRAYPGTTVDVTGGSRSYRGVQARHAGVAHGRWGYKVAAEWQASSDWENYLQYTIPPNRIVPEVGVNWESEVGRAEGKLIYYADSSRVELSGGWSTNDAVGQTAVGRNQFLNVAYDFAQLKVVTPRWFANVYRTHSESGETYAINRYSVFRALEPNRPDDEIRRMAASPADGQGYVAEAQNTVALRALGNMRVIWGGQYRYDHISSGRQWLRDAQTGKPLGLDQYGVYAQVEAGISRHLEIVLAGRQTKHEDYPGKFSPKAAVRYRPAAGHAVRLTYNRAFKNPSTFPTHVYMPNYLPGVGLIGNRDGFVVKDRSGAVVQRVAPLVPEDNATWEVGYKAQLRERFLVDLTAYRARYQHFLGTLQPINVTARGQFAYDVDDAVIRGRDGPITVLTYQDLGRATLAGTEMAARYLPDARTSVSGTLTWLRLWDVDQSPTDVQATALNSPTLRWSLSADHSTGRGRAAVGALVRHAAGHEFVSGINQGRVPGFTTADVNMRVHVSSSTQLYATVSNLVTCRGATTAAARGPSGARCGVGLRHAEIVNMPEIGTALFAGVRYER